MRQTLRCAQIKKEKTDTEVRICRSYKKYWSDRSSWQYHCDSNAGIKSPLSPAGHETENQSTSLKEIGRSRFSNDARDLKAFLQMKERLEKGFDHGGIR